MIGAIAGDVIGSVHEGTRPEDKHFPLFVPESRFTDDTVLTVAIAEALREGGDYHSAIRLWGRRYPGARYGGMFYEWLFAESPAPYHSFGNGSAMRVSAIGWAFHDLDTVLAEAARSAEITHNHPEGVKGAQAVAAAIFLGRSGRPPHEVLRYVADHFGYACDTHLSDLWERGGIGVTCQDTLPAALSALYYSEDFEDAVRNAVALGGDTDTVASITGAIAEAFYGGVPAPIRKDALSRLDAPLRDAALAFATTHGIPMEGIQRGLLRPD